MATWIVEAQALESRRWERSDSRYWFCDMTCSAGCWWRAFHYVRCRTGTHTHTHTHTHTRDLHILFHVLDTTTVVFIFPLCIRSFISLRIFFLFHHIFCFKPILFFILFFLLFSFVPSSDLFRNSFQIPQFFSPPLCSILPCFHSFLFASLSFVALTIICLYFFYIHSRPFLFWTGLYVISLLQFSRKFKFPPKFQALNLLCVQSCYF